MSRGSDRGAVIRASLAMAGALGLTAAATIGAPHGAPQVEHQTAKTGPKGYWVVDGKPVAKPGVGTHSVARLWMEELLNAIRNDFARPTVHARNLFHLSIAMWDAWAVFSVNAYPFLSTEHHDVIDVEAAREEAISYAAYRLLQARFAKAPQADQILPSLDALMDTLGYDKYFFGTIGDTPKAIGNRIAIGVQAFGLADNANEQGGYANQYYEPVNEPVVPAEPGNPLITDPNRWQPIALDYFIDQNDQIVIGGYPEALSPEWGIVTPFALSGDDLTVYYRTPPAPDEDFPYWVYHDPGPPPHIGDVDVNGNDYYKWGFELVSIWSGHLDPTDGVMWDVSPATIGNAPLPEVTDYETFYDLYDGGDWSQGYNLNPVTNQPYTPQIVPRGDYARILAEFWADGPASETPPGHWFVILNYVNDHPAFEKRMGGTGPILPDLEWDVKAYLLLGGTMHDVAVACWGAKGWYDYIRPVSAIRYMTDQGQCTDPKAASFDLNGIDLHPDWIELVTPDTIMPGGKHEHLGVNGLNKVAIYAWRGPDYIDDPDVDDAGVGWILAENWWPYQRPTFVTPPFPGYFSGHSTYSRAGATLMSVMTGSEYFPAGMGEFYCPQNEFLVFEDGPSMDVTLQWAKYVDASDQCSLSRIWGGIHPPADDLPGRHIGGEIAPDDWDLAQYYFTGSGDPCPADLNDDGEIGIEEFLFVLGNWGTPAGDVTGDGDTDIDDFLLILGLWGDCPS